VTDEIKVMRLLVAGQLFELGRAKRQGVDQGVSYTASIAD